MFIHHNHKCYGTTFGVITTVTFYSYLPSQLLCFVFYNCHFGEWKTIKHSLGEIVVLHCFCSVLSSLISSVLQFALSLCFFSLKKNLVISAWKEYIVMYFIFTKGAILSFLSLKANYLWCFHTLKWLGILFSWTVCLCEITGFHSGDFYTLFKVRRREQ